MPKTEGRKTRTDRRVKREKRRIAYLPVVLMLSSVLRSSVRPLGAAAFTIVRRGANAKCAKRRLTKGQNLQVAAPSSEQPIDSTISPDLADWRQHPALNPTIDFPSWTVPVSGKGIQTILSNDSLQPYLATRFDLLQNMHLRFKVVRDFETDSNQEQKKVVLLHPDAPSFHELPADAKEILRSCGVDDDGPVIPIDFHYKQFTAPHILNQLLPLEVHPPPAAFETIGHVAHLNLRDNHLPYKDTIGQVILETLPTIETVIHKVGEVTGPYRTYNFGVLAGRPDTDVHLQESGVKLHFDVKDVYWCSRLSEERKRLLLNEFQPGQTIADAFSGVGALLLQAAQQLNCTIWANDWNPKAVEYLKENAASNNVADKFERVQCADAYDFLMDMGLDTVEVDDDEGSVESPERRLPDHLVMNFPLEAAEFLGALRWWPVPCKDRGRRRTAAEAAHDAEEETTCPRVHVYTFAREDPDTSRSAEQVAVDLIASNLLPMGDTVNRTGEMNNDYGCQVHVHHVRDVAPGKLVMCVSFSATPRLLRCMQGDFS